jgi:ribosomal protein S18 acetylase RimI-like enzyme
MNTTIDTAADRADALLVHAYSRSLASRSNDAMVGPFAILISERNPGLHANYAIPLDFAEPSPDEVAALIGAFRARDRTPRLEFAPSAAPQLEAALLAAGFSIELRPPMMTRRPTPAVPTLELDGFDIRLAETDQDLLDHATVQKAAFGEPSPAGEADIAGLRRSLRRGGYVLVAHCRETGEAAGAGAFMPRQNDVTEVTGIAVAEPFRRRGLAEAMTGVLAGEAFRAGCSLAFLSAAGEAQSAIYARAGFIRRSPMAYMSIPNPPP